MYTTTSQRTSLRCTSWESFDSNPDVDLEWNNDHDCPAERGGVISSGGGDCEGLPTHPSRPSGDGLSSQPLWGLSRPALSSLYSLDPSDIENDPQWRSSIPYSEFGSRGPVPSSTYSDAVEQMVISPTPDEEEIIKRGYQVHTRGPRLSRLRRLTNTLLKPFTNLKSATRVPQLLSRIGLRMGRSAGAPASPISLDSGWDLTDKEPAPALMGQHYSSEDFPGDRHYCGRGGDSCGDSHMHDRDGSKRHVERSESEWSTDSTTLFGTDVQGPVGTDSHSQGTVATAGW